MTGARGVGVDLENIGIDGGDYHTVHDTRFRTAASSTVSYQLVGQEVGAGEDWEGGRDRGEKARDGGLTHRLKGQEGVWKRRKGR